MARTFAGSVPGALETWLSLRGVRTLALRVRQQTETATRLAAWLEPFTSRSPRTRAMRSPAGR